MSIENRMPMICRDRVLKKMTRAYVFPSNLQEASCLPRVMVDVDNVRACIVAMVIITVEIDTVES